MPLITRQSIENLRARIDIAQAVESYVPGGLKRSGSALRGLSPFASENSPSFYVYPDKGFYYCFSTSQGGDVFRFIQTVENLEFVDAAEHLGAKFSIDLEYEKAGPGTANKTFGSGKDGGPSLRKQLIDVYENTTVFYHKYFLSQTPAGEHVRAYWQGQRHFTPALAAEFAIGLSPVNTAEDNQAEGMLAQFLLKRGASLEALGESGLFFTPKNGPVRGPGQLRPRFRGRLMVPIRDIQGRTIAFTARQIPGLTPEDSDYEKGKYVNSPETLLFHKKAMLFNLNHARTYIGKPVRNNNENNENGEDDAALTDLNARFFLVEGQLDCLRCASVGIHTAVAPQGSAITLQQLQLLTRYGAGAGLDCLLDGDRAGQAAALKLIPLALEAGLDIRFLNLPQGTDPDDLLRDHGPSALTELTQHAQGIVPFVVESQLGGPAAFSAMPPQARSAALTDILTSFAAAASTLVQNDLIAQLASATATERRALETEFAKAKTQRSRYQSNMQNNAQARSELKPTGQPAQAPGTGAPTAEDYAAAGGGDYAEAEYAEAGNGYASAEAAEAFLPTNQLHTAEETLLAITLQCAEVHQQLCASVNAQWVNTASAHGALLQHALGEISEGMWEGPEHFAQQIENPQQQNILYGMLAQPLALDMPQQSTAQALRALHTRYVKAETAKLRAEIAATPTHTPEGQATLAKLQQRRASLKAELK